MIPFLVHKEKYKSPQIVVLRCEMSIKLLTASNEGLDFEDLFAPQQDLFDEDSFQLLP